MYVERMADLDAPVSKFIRILDKYGFPAGVAAFLIWFVATIVMTKMEHIQADVHDHVFQSGFYQQAMCRNIAILAGRPLADCAPPDTPQSTSGIIDEKKR